MMVPLFSCLFPKTVVVIAEFLVPGFRFVPGFAVAVSLGLETSGLIALVKFRFQS